jgi:hypothetical protein
MKELYLMRNEQNFLADQAANAKTSMIGTLNDMKGTLKRVTDVTSCAKQHPWLTVGWAVAAGFITGAVLTSVPDETVKLKGSSKESAPQPKRDVQETLQAKKSLLFSTAATVVAGLLQTVVQRWVAAAALGDDKTQVETQSDCDSTVKVDLND